MLKITDFLFTFFQPYFQIPATLLVFSDVPYSGQSEGWYKSHEQLS